VLAQRYWTVFESLREELGCADYLGAMQRFRAEIDRCPEGNQPLLQMSRFLIDYPFADRLYPQALAVVAELDKVAPTVILTDGDVVFQPHKVQRSGLWDAVHGRVLVCVHKELELDAIQRRYPARRYVMFDDKLRILTAMKQFLNERLLTVFVRQGHYARDARVLAQYPVADITVECIGDVLDLGRQLHVPPGPGG
jgi:hypothetical protein